jgi:tripartite-type tricarboxylate transporter receptor subunit TctC
MSSTWQQIALPDQTEFDVREFTDLGKVADTFYGFVQGSHMDSISSLDDLAAAVKDGARWGTGGVGDAYHLFPVVFGELTGAWELDDMEFVHMGGIGEFSAAMDRGEVDLATATSGSAISYIEDGIMEPLLAFSDEQYPGWEGGNTVSDWDISNPDQVMSSLTAPRIWSAPPDVPEERAEILSDALLAAAEDEEFLAQADENNRPVNAAGPEEAKSISESLYETWSQREELLKETLG